MSAPSSQLAPVQRSPSEGKPRKPFLPLSFILRRAPIIFLIGGPLTAVLLILLLPFRSTTYSTEGILLIDPTKQVTVAGREQDPFPGVFRDYMRTMLERINSMQMLTTTVQQLKRSEYPPFFNPLDPPEANAARLMKHLSVREVPMTYLISITLSSNKPDGLAPTLNRLMQVFIEKNQQEKSSLVQRRINYLALEREKILTRMAEFKGKRISPDDDQQEGLFLSPLYNGHLHKLELSRKLYLEALAKSDEEQKRYQQMQANRSRLPNLNMQPLANEKVMDNFGINRMEQWTYEKGADLRRTIDGLTEQNADRRNVEDRIKAMDEYLARYKERTSNEINKQLHEKQIYELDIEILKARHAAEEAAKHAQFLYEQEQQALKEHNEISKGIFNVTEIQFNIEQLRERLKTLNTRIDDAEVEAMAPVQLFVDKVAQTPTEPDGSNLKLLIIISVALGLGGIFSFILAFDIVDNRLRDPKELNSALGGPGADPIPVLEGPNHPPGSFVDVTFDWPRHPVSMAIRALAVRVEHECEHYGVRVIALSGLGAACGVTSLSLALAHVLRTQDRRVLVLESNLIRPGLARVHGGVEEEPGLWSRLAGENSAVDALIQHDPRRRIDVITAGGERSGIPDRSAYLGLLAVLRERYDLILVDAASILEDDLSMHAAVHADAVLLVGREDASLYRNLRETLDRLVAAQVPAISAILNFSHTKRGERIRLTIHSEMRWFSKMHWDLHGLARRGLRRLAGRSVAGRSGVTTSAERRKLSRWLRWMPERLRVRATSATTGDVPAEIGPLPLMDGEITLPDASHTEQSETCKWVYDKKRRVLINLTRGVKYPEGSYIYRASGEGDCFEILGGPDVWIPGRNVTFINQKP